MTSEIPASIQKQVDEAASIIRKHLGRHLIATYLYGSALDGGLKPESDIDLFVVVNNSLSESNRKQLMTEMLSVSSYPAAHGIRPIEVTVVDARTLKPWVYPPKRELQLGEWFRKDIESGSFESPKADPDLAILITKIRKSSIALHGPSAMEIFDEVPEADLKKALLSTLQQWQSVNELRGDERTIALAIARIWFTALTGTITSKDKAAEWLIPQVPIHHAKLLTEARNGYLGIAPDRLAEKHQELLNFVTYAQSKLEKTLSGDTAKRL